MDVASISESDAPITEPPPASIAVLAIRYALLRISSSGSPVAIPSFSFCPPKGFVKPDRLRATTPDSLFARNTGHHLLLVYADDNGDNHQ